MSTKNAQFGQRKKKHVQDDKCIDVVQDIKKKNNCDHCNPRV